MFYSISSLGILFLQYVFSLCEFQGGQAQKGVHITDWLMSVQQLQVDILWAKGQSL